MSDKTIWATSFRSKSENVVETITDLILSGDLENDMTLPTESELCDNLGVSRSVLREAMKMLGTKGLVEVRQGVGTIVKRPSEYVSIEALHNYIQLNQVSLGHVMEIRIPIEIETARLAAKNRTQQHIDAMEETLTEMENSKKQLDACAEADHAFHEALVSSTGNPLFFIVTHSIAKFFGFLRVVTIGSVEETVEQHRAILEAVRKKNSRAAVSAMVKHMKSTEKDLSEIFEHWRDERPQIVAGKDRAARSSPISKE